MKILVVVDMQNDFVSGALGTPEAERIVPNVVKRIDGWEGDICVTQDTHGADYLETQEGRLLPVPHCIEGSEGWLLAPAVENALAKKRGVHRFTKTTFGSQSLAAALAERRDEIEEIVLIGLCTDICVLSNALVLKVFLPEVPVTVDAACCAGVTPQSHRNALNAMGGCQVKIVNSPEV